MTTGSLRSIPAWAGQTAFCSSSCRQKAVYPRVGGANADRAGDGGDAFGLSPRGRGKPRCPRCCWSAPGSIPAWAGQTQPFGVLPFFPGVYPRVGGANPDRRMSVVVCWGLSPRGRGKRYPAWLQLVYGRSIPAWAGQTGCPAPRRSAGTVYPRVGGANGTGVHFGHGVAGLSPRGRGKPCPWTRRFSFTGSIPAWAGQTIPPLYQLQLESVYPRVGGANVPTTTPIVIAQGLSPRGRGKPLLHPGQGLVQRSIPAWAGQTRWWTKTPSAARVYPRVGGANSPSR